MLTVLRSKSQITIPSTIVSSLGLKEGDQLDVSEVNGMIQMIPVTVYPKSYVGQRHREIGQLKESIRSGKQPVFDNIDTLFEQLEEG